MRKVPPDITIMADTITIMTERPDRFELADQPGEGEETALTTSLHVPAGGETLPPVALLVWLSPSFPVGSFAFSHGLEWAVEAGDIKDLASLTSWIGSLIRSGGCYNDAVLLAVAWRAMQNADMASLKDANELAIGLAGSRERRLETVAQGNAFMKAVMTAWSAPAIDKAFAHVEGDFAYPVAVAIASAAHDMPLATTLAGLLPRGGAKSRLGVDPPQRCRADGWAARHCGAFAADASPRQRRAGRYDR